MKAFNLKNISDQVKSHSFFETIIHFRNYLGANIANKAMGFISLPVYTHLLLPEEYGLLNVFNAYSAFFVIIFSLNSQAAIGQFYLKNQSDFKSFFSTNVIFTTFILVFTLPFLFFMRDHIDRLLGIPASLIIYFIPIIILSTISSSLSQILQSQNKSALLSKVSIFQNYGAFILAVPLLLLLEKEKYMALIWAQMIVGILVALYSIHLQRPYFTYTFSKKHLRYILLFALPLIPYVLSSVILDQIDRIMINKFHGERETGLYSFAYNIGMLISLIYAALYSAWYPKYAHYMNEGNYVQHDTDLKKILKIVSFAALCLIFFSKELGVILAERSFHASLYIIPVVVIGYLFHAIFYVYARNIGHFDRPIYLSVVVLLAGIINIVLNVILIPLYGNIAAAYNTLISYIFMALFAWACNKYILKFYTTPLHECFKPFLIVIPFTVLYYAIEGIDFPFVVGLMIKIIIIGAYMFFLIKNIIASTQNRDGKIEIPE
jgi:O-antigen/teichoic acid export membrane protein